MHKQKERHVSLLQTSFSNSNTTGDLNITMSCVFLGEFSGKNNPDTDTPTFNKLVSFNKHMDYSFLPYERASA